MLSQFSVKNFKSFRDEMTLDMQAAAISEHVDSVIKGKDGDDYLPLAVIYGPNGGGKSTVLDAVNSLVSTVLRPIYAINPQDKVLQLYREQAKPFAFDAVSKDEPTEYEIFFSTNVAEYRYELHIKGEQVLFECLDMIKFSTKRKSTLFSRSGNIINLKGELLGLKLNEAISTTIPLLSYLGITYMNHTVVSDVISWFMEQVAFISYGLLTQVTRLFLTYSEELKRLILKMIREMDIDVTDYRTEKVGESSIQIFTKHMIDSEEYELRMSDESSGTVKIFELLPQIATAIIRGQTLIVDELDSRLHPLLLKYLINLFSDRSINKSGAQLIFTSHDMSTLNNSIFRRDEIWFVAKGEKQNSVLYSLVEFKDDEGKAVRKDAKYDKQYLERRYGADPYLKNLIDWSDPYA